MEPRTNKMAHSECTSKHKNKSNYNTDYIVHDLITFFGDDWKAIKTDWKKGTFIFVKSTVVTKIHLLLVISENFLSTMQKNNVLVISISY